MNNQKLNLRNVTLCAVDCLNPVLASRALDISRRHCLFGDTILLTDQRIDTDTRIALIPKIKSREEYSAFVLRDLVEHIHTPFVLLVQWDGFVVNPSEWTEAFFSCDYIGARWPSHQDGMAVGNGGFTLRSKRLLEILANDERFAPHPKIVEDELICRTFRPTLEAEYGIRFASEPVADQFSVEFARTPKPAFGFHGVFNMHRFVDDTDLQFFAKHAQTRSVMTIDFVDLCLSCLKEGRSATTRVLYSRLRECYSAEQMVRILIKPEMGMAQHHAVERVAAWEALLA